jgi:hypothetical protein
MDNQNPTQTGISPQGERKSMGALIGSIIIILILVLGGLYLYSVRIAPRIEQGQTNQEMIIETDQTAAETIINAPDETLSQLSAQDTSDEPEAIEKDLNATDLSDLDKDLQAL